MRNELTYRGRAYNDDALQLPSMAVDTSLNGRVLDVDTMQVTIQQPKSAGAFNPDVDQSLPVPFLRGGSQQSLWYASSVTHVGEAFYLLGLTSSLGRLLQMEHRGGVYSGETAQTLIDDICGPVPHYVDPAFQSIRLYGHLPYLSPSGQNGAQKGSAKDNLLQVLFAINATVRDDAQGVLRVENLSTGVSSILDADRIFRATTRIRHETPVTSVTVLEHQYIPGGTLTTLFEGTAAAGQVIVFDEPMSNLTATGFSITESNANYAVLSAGSGTLTGQAYIHTTREITKAVTAATLPNPVRIEGATLVSLTNSAEVINHMAEYYKHRVWIECEASIQYEDAGDVISVWDALSKTMRQACIEQISPLRASNIMRGNLSALIGYLPWQVVPFDDVRQLLTGSGTFVVPAGVTQITVVLIGGGDGGAGGENGTSGDSVSGSWPNFRTGSVSLQPGKGGKGGKAGTGGSSGKILRVELTVSAGQSFSYSCGTEGVGGAIATAGGIGGESTFGSISSASGSVSETGYVDPITGDIYARSGIDGIDGGDGGNGGPVSATEGNAGLSGQSAGQFPGGNGGSGWYGRYGPSREPTGYQSQSGGGGGGASAVAAGSNGSSNHYEYNPMVGASGGAGASAIDRPSKTAYGDGGDGGDGGGGGGGAGSFGYSQGTETGVFTLRYSAYGGARGTGAKGGTGAPGCIILYFRRPATP